MSYPINQPITYTAVAATQGSPSNTFAYAWAFDDNITANTATYAKTWASTGNRLATVTATDNTTGVAATASKTITLGDWSTFAWTSSGVKIMPDASPGFGSVLGAQQTNLIVSGNLIINIFDYYNPQTIVVFNTSTLTKVEYSSLLSVIGSPTAGFLLDSGPNSGNVLILGSGNGRYGFFNPNTGAFSLSPNTTPQLPAINGTTTSPSAKMGDGKWFVHGTQVSNNGYACMIYDSILDSWSSATGIGSSTLMDGLITLPSGNLFAYIPNSISTFVYNYLTGVWSAGPNLAASYPKGGSPISKLNDGRIIMVTCDSSANQSTWTEGNLSFVSDTEQYPYTSQNASATGNYHQTLVVAPDGMVINVGGACSGYNVYSDSKTVLHMPDGAWTVGSALLTDGFTYKQCFANGRAWRSSNIGILEYSSVW